MSAAGGRGRGAVAAAGEREDEQRGRGQQRRGGQPERQPRRTGAPGLQQARDGAGKVDGAGGPPAPQRGEEPRPGRAGQRELRQDHRGGPQPQARPAARPGRARPPPPAPPGRGTGSGDGCGRRCRRRWRPSRRPRRARPAAAPRRRAPAGPAPAAARPGRGGPPPRSPAACRPPVRPAPGPQPAGGGQGQPGQDQQPDHPGHGHQRRQRRHPRQAEAGPDPQAVVQPQRAGGRGEQVQGVVLGHEAEQVLVVGGAGEGAVQGPVAQVEPERRAARQPGDHAAGGGGQQPPGPRPAAVQQDPGRRRGTGEAHQHEPGRPGQRRRRCRRREPRQPRRRGSAADGRGRRGQRAGGGQEAEPVGVDERRHVRQPRQQRRQPGRPDRHPRTAGDHHQRQPADQGDAGGGQRGRQQAGGQEPGPRRPQPLAQAGRHGGQRVEQRRVVGDVDAPRKPVARRHRHPLARQRRGQGQQAALQQPGCVADVVQLVGRQVRPEGHRLDAGQGEEREDGAGDAEPHPATPPSLGIAWHGGQPTARRCASTRLGRAARPVRVPPSAGLPRTFPDRPAAGHPAPGHRPPG